MVETIEHADGRVELRDEALESLKGSPVFNEDLAPTKLEQRTWTTYAFAALWISMAHCIPTYILASGLINLGMSWGQALPTILLGNSIVLAPILLELAPGHQVRHPLPRLRPRGLRRLRRQRAGHHARPRRVRVVGIQCWIGGKALQKLLWAIWPAGPWPSARSGSAGTCSPSGSATPSSGASTS